MRKMGLWPAVHVHVHVQDQVRPRHLARGRLHSSDLFSEVVMSRVNGPVLFNGLALVIAVLVLACSDSPGSGVGTAGEVGEDVVTDPAPNTDLDAVEDGDPRADTPNDGVSAEDLAGGGEDGRDSGDDGGAAEDAPVDNGGEVAECLPEGDACDADAECCSDRCVSGVGDQSTCGTTLACGEPRDACDSAADCCSTGCVGGSCVAEAACASAGSNCDGDADCCGNDCSDAGLCVASGGCLSVGESCGGEGSCCSRT